MLPLSIAIMIGSLFATKYIVGKMDAKKALATDSVETIEETKE